MKQPDPDATAILPIGPDPAEDGLVYQPDPDATFVMPRKMVNIDTVDNPTTRRATRAARNARTEETARADKKHPGAKPPTGTTPNDKGIGGHSAAMALGSLVSRGTGFLRTMLITIALGSLVGNAYTNATLFPGMVYELLLGGVLASVLVPLLIRARESEPDRGEAYTQRLLSAAVIFLGAATVLAVLCAPLLARLATSGDNLALTTTWAYMTLPTIFFYGLAALFAAVLNTRGHFAAPMWAPILNNLLLCAAAIAVILLPQPGRLTLSNVPTSTILLIGLATAFGIVLQAMSLLPALRKVGFRWRWRLDVRALPLREIARLGGWMICYVAVSQVAVTVMFHLANLAAEKNAPGSLIYNNVFLLMMMAHGIIAVSILTALMPRMSASAAGGRLREVAADLSKGTRLVIVLLMPVSVAYLTLSRPISVTLFKGGNFPTEDAQATSLVMAVSAFALIPFAVSQLQTFAFYALPDTKTPALINLPVVGVRISVSFVLFIVLPASGVVAGLMLGNAVSFMLAALLSGWLLRRKLGPLGMVEILVTIVKSVIAGVLAFGAGYAVNLGLTSWASSIKLNNLVVTLVGCAAIGLVYLAAAHVLRIAEVAEAVGMVKRKLGR